jgi:hypothetical protein
MACLLLGSACLFEQAQLVKAEYKLLFKNVTIRT